VRQRDVGIITSQNASKLHCRRQWSKKSSSAIAERPRCRVGQFWPKSERWYSADNVSLSSITVTY